MNCVSCGAPCGTLYPYGFAERDKFLCRKCYNQRLSNNFKTFLGLLYLTLCVVLAAVFIGSVLDPIAGKVGVGAARNIAFGVCGGCLVGFFALRTLANHTKGCLFRLALKFLSWIACALGVGLLLATTLLWGTVEKSLTEGNAKPAPAAEVAPAPAPAVEAAPAPSAP